jgi:hypothetical protein
MRYGFSKPYKAQCPLCQGNKHLWISPANLQDSDVVLKSRRY